MVAKKNYSVTVSKRKFDVILHPDLESGGYWVDYEQGQNRLRFKIILVKDSCTPRCRLSDPKGDRFLPSNRD